MDPHWTYQRRDIASDLVQGDVLRPTEELRAVLKDVHPYFLNEKYLGFMVVSQTCDLVRRGPSAECDARYISISVVRRLAHLLFDLLDDSCSQVAPGVYRKTDQHRAEGALKKLMNQNEWKLGFLYLHPDEAVGLGEPAVAVLRVSVALHSQHYAVLCRARTCGLDTAFANKLGWMTGNLFSRIGTPDWPDTPKGESPLDKAVQRIMRPGATDDDAPAWLTDDEIAAARRAKLDLASIPRAKLRDALAGLSIETNVDRAVREVERVVREVVPDIGPEKLQSISARLRTPGVFTKNVRKLGDLDH